MREKVNGTLNTEGLIGLAKRTVQYLEWKLGPDRDTAGRRSTGMGRTDDMSIREKVVVTLRTEGPIGLAKNAVQYLKWKRGPGRQVRTKKRRLTGIRNFASSKMEHVSNLLLRWSRSIRPQDEPSAQGEPHVLPIGRYDYKATWERLSATFDSAKMHVGATTDEEKLDFAGRYTVDLLERLVGVNPSDTILEIGCGVGRVGKFLSSKCTRWIGTDISGRMLEYAAQRLKGIENIELIELSTVGLAEIPDNSVDMVYCTVVFMHLSEWDRYRYVTESFRVLKPGGRCFYDNTDIISTGGWQVFMNGFLVDPDKRPPHISMISTGDELETYARRAGFMDVKVHRWDDNWVGVTGVRR